MDNNNEKTEIPLVLGKLYCSKHPIWMWACKKDQKCKEYGPGEYFLLVNHVPKVTHNGVELTLLDADGVVVEGWFKQGSISDWLDIK